MSLQDDVKALSDDDALACLNGVLKGLAAQSPELEGLFAQPAEMDRAIREIPQAAGQPSLLGLKVDPQQRAEAARQVLAVMADGDLAPRVRAYLDGARPKMLEPVSTALIVAGVVALLSTQFEGEVKQEDGQTSWHFKFKKDPTSESILKQILGIFGI